MRGGSPMAEPAATDDFEGFAKGCEARLRPALCGTFGVQVGQDALAETMAWAWEHWDRLQLSSNRVGYLWGVGRHRALDLMRRRVPEYPPVDTSRLPWVEPGLPAALARLPQTQRTAVVLV